MGRARALGSDIWERTGDKRRGNHEGGRWRGQSEGHAGGEGEGGRGGMAWRRMDRWRTDSCAESLVLRECTKMSTATQTAPSRYIRGGILGRRMRGILGRRMRAQPFVKCKEVQGLSLRAQSCGNAASRLTTDVNVAAEMALRTAFCNVCARAEACGRSRRGGAVHALSATPCNRGKPTFFFLLHSILVNTETIN